MVVVRSRKKKDNLEALHQSDLVVGPVPSAIQKHLKSMTDKGYIARREKDGQWDVFIIPSV